MIVIVVPISFVFRFYLSITFAPAQTAELLWEERLWASAIFCGFLPESPMRPLHLKNISQNSQFEFELTVGQGHSLIELTSFSHFYDAYADSIPSAVHSASVGPFWFSQFSAQVESLGALKPRFCFGNEARSMAEDIVDFKARGFPGFSSIWNHVYAPSLLCF